MMDLPQKKLEPLCDVSVLKTKRVLLVQEVIFENVMPSVEPLLLYRQADVIRSEKAKCDRIGKLLDILERLTSSNQYEAFNAFIKSLAGTQPGLFETLCKRPPTDTESDFCVKEAGLSIRQAVEKTGHRTDSQLDEQIDFQYEYVELATDRGWKQGGELPHQYNCHLDDIHKRGQNVSAYDWLLGNEEKDYENVSIYGRAGIGKSTTFQFFAKLWAQGKWATGFTMMFLLQLRFITTQVITISTVELLQFYGLYAFPEHCESTPFTSWLKNSASRILILLDGLDEIPGFAKRMVNTPKIHDVLQKAHPVDLCINILRGDLLPGCTVISASRPFAGLDCLPADAKAEILGLTTAKVNEYVERRHPGHVEAIMSVLRKNPILLSVCGITFYCMLITRLLSEGVTVLDEDIKTYTRLMSFIIIQYCSRKMHDSAFPIEVSSYFSKLSQLAYSGIFQLEDNKGLAKLVFDEVDLAKANINRQDLENIKKAGILQIMRRKIGRHESWTAEFFHLSAQELLSVAYLLSHPQIPDQTLTALFESGQFNLALRFLLGLHFDKENVWIRQISTAVGSSCDSDQIDSTLSTLLDSRVSSGKVGDKMEMCQLLFEGQCDEKAENMAKHIAPDRELDIGYKAMTAIDLLAVDYVCQNLRSITLRSVNADDTFVDVLVSSLCKHHKETLQVLNLPNNKIGKAGAASLATMLSENSSLHTLDVYANQIGDEGAQTIAQSLVSNTSLRELNISEQGGLQDEHLGDAGAIAMADMLLKKTSLKALVAHANSIGNAGAFRLAEMLLQNSSLEILNISCNLINDVGAMTIANAFCNTDDSRVGVEKRESHVPVQSREEAGENTPLLPQRRECDVEVRRRTLCGCLSCLCTEETVRVRRWRLCGCLPCLCTEDAEGDLQQCSNSDWTECSTTDLMQFSTTTVGSGVDQTQYSTTGGPGVDVTLNNTREAAGLDPNHYNTTLRKLHIHGRHIGHACAKVLINIRQHDTNLDIYV